MFRLRHFPLLAAVAGVMALTPDTPAVSVQLPGGAVMGALLVEQIDGQIFRIDLGPAKGNDARGIVMVHANRFTRFTLTAGVRGFTLVGSLGGRREASLVRSPRD